MQKTKIINGVKFRLGELRWEDAYGVQMCTLPDFSELKKGGKPQGAMISTLGWIAKVGGYWLVISETGHPHEVYDYTLVPACAKVTVI